MHRVMLTLMMSWMLVGVALAAPPPPAPELGPAVNAMEVAEDCYAEWVRELGQVEAQARLLRLEGATGALLLERVEDPLPQGAPEAVSEGALEEAHP